MNERDYGEIGVVYQGSVLLNYIERLFLLHSVFSVLSSVHL